MPARIVAVGAKTSKVVIVGAGPAGIHFAKRLKDEGYAARDITILESQKRFGGKSFTEFLPEQPNVRHELGTCYMHLGYEPVRKLLAEYDLGDTEVGLGAAYLKREKDGAQRKVWDLKLQDDYSRGDLKGQDFDDWLLRTADKKEVEGFYSNNEPSPDERLANVITAAKQKPQTFVKGLRVLQDTSGAPVGQEIFGAEGQMSDNEVIRKLDRIQAVLPAVLGRAGKRAPKDRRGAGKRAADFEDLPDNEIDGARFVVAGLNLVLQIGRYVDAHEALFGAYEYGLPPQPSAAALAEIDCTFREWLDRNEFYALLSFFVYSQAAQGYGSLEKVPTFYGLWWNHPNYIGKSIAVPRWILTIANVLINGPLPLPNFVLGAIGSIMKFLAARSSPSKEAPAAQAVLQSGFSKLWENIVKQEELEVKLNCAVTNIDRSGPTPVVTYKDRTTDEEVSISATEFVVLAVPLLPAMQGVTAYTKGASPGQSVSPPVVDEVTRRDPIFSPTKEEKEVLGDLESYTLKTVLFKADPFPEPGPIYPGEVWAKALEEYGGRVRYLTNSELSTLGTETPGQTGYVAYQALDEPPNEENDAVMKKKFAEDVAAIGLTNVDVVLEKPWYYFPHFPQQAVQSGAPWKLMELQGKHGMYFAGSSCCFESVLDVMAYNDLLMQKFILNKGTKDAENGSARMSSEGSVASSTMVMRSSMDAA